MGAFLWQTAGVHPVTIRRWRLRYGAAFPTAPCTKTGIRTFVREHKRRMERLREEIRRRGQVLTGPLKGWRKGLTDAMRRGIMPSLIESKAKEDH